MAEFRTCQFCDCLTNAALRACCERGRQEDVEKSHHNSTAAMCAAWFGTPGCGPAIEAVFGNQSATTSTAPHAAPERAGD